MHANVKNFKEGFDFFQEQSRKKYDPKQARRVISETESGVFRLLLPLMGWKHKPSGRKLCASDKLLGFKFMESIEVRRFPQMRRLFNQSRANFGLSQSSLNTYGARVEKLLDTLEDNGCWPVCSSKSLEIQNQCVPKRNNIHGNANNFHLTDQRGGRSAYTLEVSDEMPHFFKWEQATVSFLTRPRQPGRVFDAISPESAQDVLQRFYLLAGWAQKFYDIPLKDFRPEHVLPKVSKAELKALSPDEQEILWDKLQMNLEDLIYNHQEFLHTEKEAYSPYTLQGRLWAIKTILRVLYADFVKDEEDYKNIPLFKTLAKLSKEVSKEVIEWQKTGGSVVDLSKRWPDVPEGSTALEEVQKKIIEPLRLECRPRNFEGRFRSPSHITRSYQHFFKYGLSGYSPALRQQVDRSTKIALSCPIIRPDYVPEAGLCYPLPPDKVREKDSQGKVIDNYIYRTYHFKGQNYPEGVWIREVCGYKTRKTYGVFHSIIPNREFEDSRCFYDYIEEYLQGVWVPGPFRNRITYQWWDQRYQGKMGRWVTSGRAEFNPKDYSDVDLDGISWRWGYLFIGSDSGMPFSKHGYGVSFFRNSFRLIGKRITPHSFRYFWATWGFQVGLTDTEMRALAYMMGHSVETLRQMYEKTTSLEKQQIIENAINNRLCRPAGSDKLNLHQIINSVKQLSSSELWQLLQIVQDVLQGKQRGSFSN